MTADNDKLAVYVRGLQNMLALLQKGNRIQSYCN